MTSDVFSWCRLQEEIVMERKNKTDECSRGFRFCNLKKKKAQKILPVEKLLKVEFMLHEMIGIVGICVFIEWFCRCKCILRPFPEPMCAHLPGLQEGCAEISSSSDVGHRTEWYGWISCLKEQSLVSLLLDCATWANSHFTLLSELIILPGSLMNDMKLAIWKFAQRWKNMTSFSFHVHTKEGVVVAYCTSRKWLFFKF